MQIFTSIAGLIFIAATAHADISALTFEEATASNVVSSSSSTTVYGGLAGSDMNCSTTSTCDSCTNALAPCNHRRISDNLYLTMYFKTSTDMAGKTPVIRLAVDDSSEFTPEESSSSISKNDTLTAQVKWSTLCTEISMAKSGSATSCNFDSTATTVYVGIDTDNDGDLDEKASFKVVLSGQYLNSLTGADLFHKTCITGNETLGTYEGFCHFQLKKGDGKIHIEDAAFPDPSVSGSSSKFPSTTDSNSYAKLHFYFNAEEGTPEAPPACTIGNFGSVFPTSDYDEINLTEANDSWNLDESEIRDLDNGNRYYFIMANVDLANNVFGFSDPSTYSNCDLHSAVPEEVLGLLSDEKCFVATAAYGGAFQSEVKTLRQFRDRVLLQSQFGKWLTSTYYKYSPSLAKLIKESEGRRALARSILSPIVSIAGLWLHFGGWIILLLSLILAGGGYLVYRHKN